MSDALARDTFAGTPRDTFVILLARGFYPVAIHPEGKRPIGKEWGLERWTLERANRTFRDFKGAGVGVCLGPGRAPGDGWLIDVEGDGPEADESRVKLFDSEVIPTLGWESTRGRHALMVADVERLKAIMPGLKEYEGKGPTGRGAFHPPWLPGLELRMGGYLPEWVVKQVQSVVPPTPGTDGQCRVWTGPATIAEVPESFYRALVVPAPEPRVVPTLFAGEPAEKRRIKAHATGSGEWISNYAAKALADEAGAVASTEEGERHDKLRHATMNIAGVVNAGQLGVLAYRKAFADAARECGLPEADASELIESALEKAEPRDLTRAKAWEPPQNEQAEDVGRNGHHEANGQAQGPPRAGDDKGRDARSSRPRFSNFHHEKGVNEEGETTFKLAPNVVQEIDECLSVFAPGWPKRVQETLFIGTQDHEPVYLNSSTRLFAWVDGQAKVDWTKGGRFITQERFFEHKRMTAERYEAIEVMPHTPSLPDIYYMHRELPEPSGKLERFIDYFSPSTPIDRQLIKAMISTPSWGAHPGHRPGFMVTGPEHDPEQGRGLGKTEIVSIISDQIYGGYIDVSPTDAISDVKTRLLTDDATIKRIVRLDNVKTLKFSWADLEGLMTASEISGRALYKGEGRRPNTIVWFITLNGASLSKDMAQRVIPIKLKRPEFKAGWVEEVKAFAADHRWEILADVAAFLRSEPGPLKARTRWASWERDILSKLDQAERCQAEIIERQGKADDDNTDRDHVRDYFASMLKARDKDPETSCVFIPSMTAAEWLSDATRKHFETNKSSAHINGLGISELIQSRESKRRGFIWLGKDSVSCVPDDLAKIDEDNNSKFVGKASRSGLRARP
jgi:hypothetical protein